MHSSKTKSMRHTLARATCAHWLLLRQVAKVLKRRLTSSPVRRTRRSNRFWIHPSEAFFLRPTHQNLLSRALTRRDCGRTEIFIAQNGAADLTPIHTRKILG